MHTLGDQVLSLEIYVKCSEKGLVYKRKLTEKAIVEQGFQQQLSTCTVLRAPLPDVACSPKEVYYSTLGKEPLLQ